MNVIVADHPDEMEKLTKWHYGVLKSMYVPLMTPVDFMKFENYIDKSEIIVDALLGYGIDGGPRNFYASLIGYANNAKNKGAKIIAIDVPSGLDADTGKPNEPCIKANWTLTLTLPKTGIVTKDSRKYCGEIYVADVGVPHEAYELLGIAVPRLFEKEDIVKI